MKLIGKLYIQGRTEVRRLVKVGQWTRVEKTGRMEPR